MHGSSTCEWCRSPLGRGHWKSCTLWFCAELFFLLGLIALVAAWVTDYRGTTWLGVESDYLFHDAIAFLLLSAICKLKKISFKQSKLTMMLMDSCGDECGPDSSCCGSSACGEGGCGGDCQGGDCGPDCPKGDACCKNK